MIEIKVLTDNPNLIKETLNRIGICNRKERVLYPSCYLHESDGRFYVIHFKEWFLLNRKDSYNNINSVDENRVLFIASLLKRWGLVEFSSSVEAKKDDVVYILKKTELPNFAIKHKIKY